MKKKENLKDFRKAMDIASEVGQGFNQKKDPKPKSEEDLKEELKALNTFSKVYLEKSSKK